MKKAILLLSPIFLIVQLVQAQKPDAAVALVRYTFSHIRDTTNKAKVYTENMELLLGKNASVYRNADKHLQNEEIKRQVAEQFNAGARGNITINVGKKVSSTEYYQFQAGKQLVRSEKIINNYLIEEVLPVIPWKITTDTSSFGSLHCQKATAAFKGRNYEAWFCPDLPFRSGPWKLNGLPGLIIEASESKKEVVFKFAGLEDVSKAAESKSVAVSNAGNISGKVTKIIGLNDDDISFKTIALPENGIKTTEKEFVQLKEMMRKDPNAFLQSAMAGSGASFKIDNVAPPSIEQIKENTINNPIELPEKP